jgi:hypothetical protein
LSIFCQREQQEARANAYLQVRREGPSEAEAQNISARVGNEVGAAAISRLVNITTTD